GYHQSAVGHLSPFIHECRTYYLNSRLRYFMLIGCFIRGYKIFPTVTFVPFLSKEKTTLSIFIGDNGVGKSSILEALDLAFNDREWNVNNTAKKSEAFICPVFLIEKRHVR
ncbi:AAA family ATPase, partial [Aeromonas veronii]